MSQLKVIRASAGSGKTYRITSDYLRLLFRYPKNYKLILAVTFTNKATEEMKSRILNELYKISNNEHSPHSEYLSKEFNLSASELAEKANYLLQIILHNYSRFSISTIDSFFQRIIKSFAREAGLQSNFEVALDTDEILDKAADQMLLKLVDDKDLLNWLSDFAEERVEEGRGWDFKQEILRLGKQLFNEQFKSFQTSFHKKISDRGWLKEFQKKLYKVRSSFESKLLNNGRKGVELILRHGLKPTDFKYGSQGSVGMYFLKLSKGEIFEPSKRILDAAGSLDNWLPKGAEAALIQSAADAGLFKMLQEILSFYIDNYPIYKSSVEVLRSFYTLGILADLSLEVNEYAAKNNIFVLANSGAFLKAIIGENDTPFIYEKTGQAYHHFMIDEFQDTSGIQWFNFKPLVNNSLAEGHNAILVGDVKQSIYRWRNSDWQIMAYQLDKDIAEHGIRYDNIGFNWRSKHNIVAFNNTFFYQAPKLLQQYLNQLLSEKSFEADGTDFLKQVIEKAYLDSMQKLPSGRSTDEGYIKIQFVENENKDWKENTLPLIIEDVNSLQNQGFRLKEIAILVRTAAEGRIVIDYLNEYSQSVPADHPFSYNVISNESAFLKNSSTVIFLIKVFRYLVNPGDEINKASLALDCQLYFEYISASGPPNNNQCKEAILNIATLPSKLLDIKEQLKYLPPDELFERIVEVFELNKEVNNLPFLQAFHDCIAEFMKVNPASISSFLEYWDEKQSSFSVSVSEGQDAIRVLTIHKSKGLEFSNVIVPFCNWNFESSGLIAPVIWCSSDKEPFNELEHIPLRYSSALQDSVFAYKYYTEKAQMLVDNLNLLYVAFTRAAENLFVFAPLPQKENKFSATGELLFAMMLQTTNIQNTEYPHVNISEFWKTDDHTFEYGKLLKTSKSKTNSTEAIFLDKYPVGKLKEKLRQRNDAEGFWDRTESKKPPIREYGNIMHRLFQNIITVDDIEKAVNEMILNGFIKQIEKDNLIAEIKSILSEMPFSEWFSGKWKVMNEAGIVVPGQHIYRPDRVLIHENEAVVVDYKFGKRQNASYNAQVKQYSGYLGEMGFKIVEGFVWYVNLNLVEKVN
jgi:ATP-dependent exoDNAse (exonuclease V) beta subunit